VDVQRRQSELDNVEVKAAWSMPGRLYEPLSALLTAGGGVLLFGLEESKDFSIVGVGDAAAAEEITNLASAEMEPALRPHFLVDEIDGETVATVEVGGSQPRKSLVFTNKRDFPRGRTYASATLIDR
jgi:ATP-dependent DNA helicase RecG